MRIAPNYREELCILQAEYSALLECNAALQRQCKELEKSRDAYKHDATALMLINKSALESLDKLSVVEVERDALAAEGQRLREALQGLSDMYTHAWDTTEGGLHMMAPSVERFDKAHAAARIALGKPLCGDLGEDSEDAALHAGGEKKDG